MDPAEQDSMVRCSECGRWLVYPFWWHDYDDDGELLEIPLCEEHYRKLELLWSMANGRLNPL